MEDRVVIFLQDSGAISVVYPTPEALAMFDLDEIARRSVPAGRPYGVIASGEVPQNEEDRAKWVIFPEDLDGGIGEQ